ncbi:MAG: hypothetical protein ACOC2D_00250 [Spirochaetota bacterium]
MADILASLPQGVYWYPAVAVLVVIAVRALLSLPTGRRAGPRTEARAPSALAGYASLVERARSDRLAAAELERLCMGMLLQAVGYRGYSTDACRHYAGHGAPEHLVPSIVAHLEQPGTVATTGSGTLPERCELILRELEFITEVP